MHPYPVSKVPLSTFGEMSLGLNQLVWCVVQTGGDHSTTTLENCLGDFNRVKHSLSYDSAILYLDVYPREMAAY